MDKQSSNSKNLSIKEVPTYILNLDLPESQRWIPILSLYKSKFDVIRQNIDMMLNINNLSQYLIGSIISELLHKVKYLDELKCISEVMNIQLEKLILLQLSYEMSAACTTICTKVKGKSIMFRTMDWPMDFLKDLTINVRFIKGGKTVFIGTRYKTRDGHWYHHR